MIYKVWKEQVKHAVLILINLRATIGSNRRLVIKTSRALG